MTSARPRDSSRTCVRLIERTPPRATRPLGSTPITRASSLLRAGPPACPATVLSALRSQPPGALPVATRRSRLGWQYRDRPSHVPRESRRPGSRRLHAGHHLARKRAPARLVLEQPHCPSFDAVSFRFDTSAAIRLRSPSWSPPDASTAPCPHRSPRTAFSRRSMRRFEASPHRATPKGHNLHLPRSTASTKISYRSTSLSAFVAHKGAQTRTLPVSCQFASAPNSIL